DTLRVEQAWLTAHSASPRPERRSLTNTLQSYEKRLIEAALTESNGKVAGADGAAAKLGIPRSTLDARIKQLNIKRHTGPMSRIPRGDFRFVLTAFLCWMTPWRKML